MNILNRHTLQSWPPGAVYIGRGTALGNPYVIGEHGDRDDVCDQYNDWLAFQINSGNPAVITALMGLRDNSALVCSCAPARCHGHGVETAWKRLVSEGLPPRPRSMAYAGIGSRKAPVEELRRMRLVAERLALRGYTLRSGAANGADAAFESGAGDQKEIFLPWPGFNGHPSSFSNPSREAFDVAKAVHPAWKTLSNSIQKLQARNSHQILGACLLAPVDFVACWTADGCKSELDRTRDTGGTGQAIALAARWQVPVFNMARKDALERLKRFIDGGVCDIERKGGAVS